MQNIDTKQLNIQAAADKVRVTSGFAHDANDLQFLKKGVAQWRRRFLSASRNGALDF